MKTSIIPANLVLLLPSHLLLPLRLPGRVKRALLYLMALLIFALLGLQPASAQVVTNATFELPVLLASSSLASYQPGFNVPGWTFLSASGVNAAGLISPPGDYAAPMAPDGSQIAFLQEASAAFSQTITLPAAGPCVLTYFVAGRPTNGTYGGNVTYSVLLDSSLLVTNATTTNGQAFTLQTVTFTATAGSHLLTFTNSPTIVGDNTAFFDDIQIATPITNLFNTGVDASRATLSGGAMDPHYRLVSSADSQSPGPAAYVFLFVPGNYVGGNGPNSAWIAPQDSAEGPGSASGNYDYQTSFTLSASSVASAAISGSFAADDSATILLNGQPVSGPSAGGPGQWYPFTITSGFVSGSNTLDFIVNNASAYTGLRVAMSGTALPPFTNALGPGGCQPAPSGLVSWWPAEGNALDIESGNNGTLENGATFASGEVGQAFSFNGANQYVQIPDSPSLELASVTLDCWFNSSNTSGNLISKPVGSANYDSFVLWLAGGNLNADVGNNSAQAVLSYAFTPVPGVWYHAACTFDNNSQTQTLYLNGSPVAAGAANLSISYDSNPVLIGTEEDYGSPAFPFTGEIGEVSIYQRALSPNEIAAIYLAGSAGKCASELPPVIVQQPLSVVSAFGGTATFSATINGTSPFTYRWLLNGTNLAGATNQTLLLTNLLRNQEGLYSLAVRNTYGNAISSGASLSGTFPIYWTNTSGGNWSVPANWSPNQVPGPVDDAVITANGTYLVTLDASPNIHSLTLGGASGQQRLTSANNSLTLAAASVVNANGVLDFANNSFVSSNALTVSGAINWQSASWAPMGGVTLTSGGVLNILNNLDLYGPLTNRGTVNWQGGFVRIWNNATTQTGVICNQANALWNIHCDQPLYAGNGGEQFHNAGLLRKTAGLGTTPFNAYLDNTGTVEAKFGTILLNGNSNLGGSFVADANTAINLAGNYTNGPATSLTGAGTFALLGGATLTLQTNVIPNLNLTSGTVFLDATFQPGGITNLTLNGASLNITNTLIGNLTLNNSTLNGSLTVLSGGVLDGTNATLNGTVEVGGNGVFNWAGGNLDSASSLVVGAGGTLNISSSLWLYSAVTNQGTVNWKGGQINVYNDGATQTGAIWNQVNGVWNINCNGYSIVAQHGPEQFHNAGLLRQTAGGGSSYLQIFLDNSGTVEAQTGTIQVYNSNLGGSFIADANATINLVASYTSGSGGNNSGAGTFQFIGGTLTLLNNAIPNLQLNSGTVLLDPSFQGGTITNLTLNGASLAVGAYTVSGNLALYNSAVSGMLTVLAGGACTASNTTFSATVAVNANALFNWGGGSLQPGYSFGIAPNGILNIQGNIFSYGPITNQGTVNQQAGFVRLYYNGSSYLGQIWNQAGALWNIQDDSTAVDDYWGGEQFNNAGVLRKNNSFGVSYINAVFDNSGTVEAQTGTIDLQNGGTLGGSFIADTNTAINLAGNYTNAPGGNLTGPGAFQFNSGTLTLFTNTIPNLQFNGGTVLLDPSFQGGAITNLTLNGATLGGTNTVSGNLALHNSAVSGMLTVLAGGACTASNTTFSATVAVNANALFNWVGGTLGTGSSLTIAPGGILNIAGSLNLQSTVTNQGTVNWQAGNIQLYNYPPNGNLGEIWNQPGAVWNAQCDATLNFYNWCCWYGTGEFHNAGAFRKNSSLGTTYLQIIFDNSGTLEAQSGTINLQNGGTCLGGNFIADTNTAIILTGNYSIGPGANLSGPGTFQFNSGTLTLFTNTIPNLQLNGGTVLLDPSFQGGAITNLTLNGATLTGTNTVSGNLALYNSAVSGMLTVLAGGACTASNTTFSATVAVNANALFNWGGGSLQPGYSFAIAPGGVLNIAGSLNLQSTVTNQGTVNWQAGNIQLYNYPPYGVSGEIWNQAGAVWNAQCDATLYFYNWCCWVGTGEFHNAGAFRKISSLGTTYLQIIFDNSGLLDAQSGQIYFNGQPYTLEPGGTLNFGINGLFDYGSIYLSGSSPLNGTLSANFNDGYVPSMGDSFSPLTYGSAETGAFTGLNLPSDVSWQTNYSSTFFTLTALQGLEMTPIPTQFVKASTPFTVTVAVADSEVPPDSLTYSLVSPPGGMTIGPNSGVINWNSPASASTNTVVVNVTDNGSPALQASTSFAVIVVPSHLNVAPVLPLIPTLNVNELTLLTVTNTATESDVYATLAYSLVTAPAGAAINAGGIVTWTPAQTQSPSTNLFTVVVTNTDPYVTDSQQLGSTRSFTVIVHEVNVAPQLPVILTQTINELTPLSVANAATEANIHATLAYGLVGALPGMSINSAGLITWTPSQAQSPGPHVITTVVTNTDLFDTVNPHLTATNSFTVVVNEVNVAPTLGTIPTQNVNELALLTVNNPATETDIHATLAYSLVSPPAGMTISSSGVITWTPAQTQSPSTNLITTIVTDTDAYDLVTPNLSATNSFNAIVKEVNVAPVLPSIQQQTVNELNLLTVTNTAAESNIHATLSYSLLSPLGGMAISSSGVFTWTPTQAQSPLTNVVTTVATATDALDTVNPQLKTTNFFTVVVREVNVAPTLPLLANTNINELSLLNVTNTATETDIHATLSYGLVGAPANMQISANGIITWTPSQTQSPSTNLITTIVTNTDAFDLVNPHLYATNSFTVFVKEVNVAPTLSGIPNTNINELTPLNVTNTATETDIHATLVYTLVSPPAGMTIDANGVITWTPAQTQSPSTNLITTVVTNTDAFDTVNPHLSATNSFTVFVKEVNVAPVLSAIPQQTVNELTLLTVTNAATDSNIHAALSYSLLSPLGGMAINSSGVFTWTPSQAQSPGTNVITTVATATDPFDTINPQLKTTNFFTVFVKEVNVAPVMPNIPTQNVNELALLTVTNTATDSNQHATLAYALLSPPAGAAIDTNGIFTWTPAQTQSPSTNTITVAAISTDLSDGLDTRLASINSFQVIVHEVNVAPLLSTIPAQTVNDLALLTVTNAATESNIHATLAYGLVSPPIGMTINSSGVITWTPSQSQGPGTNLITTIVTNTDSYDTLNPHLNATNTFTVIVYAPTLAPIGNFTVNVGQTVAFTASAADNDATRVLAFSLVGAPPAGATIGGASGAFNWRPGVANANTTNTILVKVSDNSAPVLSATNSFKVMVNALTSVTLGPLTHTAGQAQIKVTGPIGPDYILLSSTTLAGGSFTNRLLTNTPTVSPFTVTDTNAAAYSYRFYRIVLGP